MAGEIQFSFVTGKTCYFQVRNRTGQVWNTGTLAFEAYLTANIANYNVAMSEQGSASAFYVGTFPATIVPGVYSIVGKQQIGGGPAESDPSIANGDFQWNGS